MNSKTCWLEWVVADKDYDDSDKYEIIQGMLEYTTDMLKESGYYYVVGLSTHPLLENIYTKAGFDSDGPVGKEHIKVLIDE